MMNPSTCEDQENEENENQSDSTSSDSGFSFLSTLLYKLSKIRTIGLSL